MISNSATELARAGENALKGARRSAVSMAAGSNAATPEAASPCMPRKPRLESTRTRGRTLLSSFIKGTPLSYDQRVGSGVKPLLYI